MSYWVTTHWPPREDEPAEEGSGIWLPDGREAPGARIRAGDLVFVYQARSGRTLARTFADGTTRRVRCRTGREGVVHLGRVRAPLAADPSSEPEHYSDGTAIWWRWHAPIDIISRSGFVPREQLATILGYKRTYNFRGFGEEHSGLRQLTEAEYAGLLERFRSERPLLLTRPPVPHGSKGGIGGGESQEHKQLKQFVAADPAAVLGETGLRTLEIEYPFPTGDRADVVLADGHDRIIGVEVEPAVGDMDEVGVLQAIKYRRMLEWSTNRAHGDSRAFLVAYSVSDSMRERCAKYQVECFEIARERVTGSTAGAGHQAFAAAEGAALAEGRTGQM